MSFETKEPDIGRIIGKRVKAVVVKRRERRDPAVQLFLVFSDDSVYEFYGEIHPTAEMRLGEKEVLRAAARDADGTVIRLPDRRTSLKLVGRRERRSLPRASASRRAGDAN